MSIRSQFEFEKLRAIGAIVHNALARMAAAARPGVTTAELDAIGAQALAENGAQPAPPKVYGFPGSVCISINDEAIHGIPGERTLESGDLVKLDLVAEKDGFFADAAITLGIGRISETAHALIRCAQSAFRESLKAACAGNRVYEIGRSIEREVRHCGFSVMRELCGHGVGRTIHEEPNVPNYRDARCRTKLSEGLVIAIEPIIAAGIGRSELQRDGWTIRTADRSLSAHYEHTVVITNGQPILLTA